ncbi:hypothetical protein, conserved [Eimeria praecox]|uniref:Uncharacterized protein n=1 Tax=Eimeria praecox TaxID=51316 RepID=U6G4X9_9EIME|nr:hypothetical protein, conserved [Eimeria praecox]
MAIVPIQRAGGAGVAACLLQLAFVINLVPVAFAAEGSSEPSQADAGGGEVQQGERRPRVPHSNTFQVVEDIEGMDGELSAEWLSMHAHLPLLKLALPATYMSTLIDVNTPKYAGKVEAQDLGVLDQLVDGIRHFDARLWRDERATDPMEAWYTEVPWRLFEDGELLKGIANGKPPASFSPTEMEALEVHSRTNIVDGLFKPVLQFLRKAPSEVVVVVLSAVNGNTHTRRNMIAKGSELAESLAHADEQLKAFLQSGQPYSDNAHEANSPASAAASTLVRVVPHSAYQSPWLDSFVKKGVSFDHFAEITKLIDTHWGPLLLHHSDMFVGANNESKSMRDSVTDIESFREWQRSQGVALLGKPISELLDIKVRLILFVDDPLLAWFITTRSRSQVVALVKADHVYDVSYMSESFSAPCASPHTARTGGSSKSRDSSWPACRSWCTTVGPKECTSWSWKPAETDQKVQPARSRREGDLSSIWEERADEELGRCELFGRAPVELSFEAITQGADCPNDDLITSDLPWDNMAVMGDLLLSILPVVKISASSRRRNMRGVGSVSFGFDSRVSMLTTGSASGHEEKYGISQKLIRVLFAPPTPQVRIEASQRAAYSSRGDAVRRFNATLADLVLAVLLRYHILERNHVQSRPINAIQLANYRRIRSRLEPFASASFFQHMTILNPSAAINPHLLAFPFPTTSWRSFRDDVVVFHWNSNCDIFVCLHFYALVHMPSQRLLAEGVPPPCDGDGPFSSFRRRDVRVPACVPLRRLLWSYFGYSTNQHGEELEYEAPVREDAAGWPDYDGLLART